MDIKVGMTGTAETIVNGNNTAKALGSGDLEVFATPAMIALMEAAAVQCLKDLLSENTSTVGTLINVKHLTATPIGMSINAKATLLEIDGKRLIFKVEAFDQLEKIGEGQHERFIINIDRFLSKTYTKK